MRKGAHLVETLRSGTFRDPKTGQFLMKPKAPDMRVVEKGFGTYREVSRSGHPPKDDESQSR